MGKLYNSCDFVLGLTLFVVVLGIVVTFSKNMKESFIDDHISKQLGYWESQDKGTFYDGELEQVHLLDEDRHLHLVTPHTPETLLNKQPYMYGSKIRNNDPQGLPITKVFDVDGKKVYGCEDGRYTKLVSANEGSGKYYVGKLSDFKVADYDDYRSVGSAYKLGFRQMPHQESVKVAKPYKSGFKKYDNKAIHGHNKSTLKDVDISACEDECKKETWCKGYEYNRDGRYCHLDDVGTSSSEWDDNSGYDYYEKPIDCNCDYWLAHKKPSYDKANRCQKKCFGLTEDSQPVKVVEKKNPTFKMYGNRAISGNNRKTIKNTDIIACETECKKEKWCRGFEYNKKNKYCNLDDVGPNLSGWQNNSSYNYYENPRKTSYKTYNNKAISGHNIATIYTDDINKCKTACNLERWCKGFEYNKKSKYCHLDNIGSNSRGWETNSSYNYYENEDR